MNKKLKLTLTLFLVGALSGILISQVNAITKPIIEQRQADTELNLYKEIYPSLDSFEKEEVNEGKIIEKVTLKAGSEIVGYVYKVSGNNSYGSITALVGITPDLKIKNIAYSSFSQTPGFGDKVKKDEFMDQFNSVDAASLVVDSMAGATYSSTLVKELVTEAISYHGGGSNE